MASEILGRVTCPHCGNPAATVHREARGKKALYYRCYGGEHGDCGTVQIRGAAGQKWLEKNIQPLEPERRAAAVEAAAVEAAAAQADAADRMEKATGRRRSDLDSWFDD